MLKKNSNLWWFLLLAGIIIPIVSSATFGTYPYYFFTKSLSTGLNPGLIYLVSFLVILIIGIAYINLKINLVIYILISILILGFFYIGFFIHFDNGYTFNSARRYFDSNISTAQINKWHLLFPNIAISICFILFATKNYRSIRKNDF